MGIFDKITRGITRGIGNAVSNATQKAVERKATEILTPKINQAADTIAGNVEQSSSTANKNAGCQTNSLESAISNLNGSINSYVNKTACNIKICSKCEKPTSADKKFCPNCGELLPETTVAQGAVCSACGKQNGIEEKFCSECGAKLPQTLQSEQKALQENENVLARWQTLLPEYPVWTFGGKEFYLENYDTHFVFSSKHNSYEEGLDAVKKYRQLLLQNGFVQAGQYPSIEHLYKKINGICYHVDTEHCFEGDADRPSIGFDKSEPTGGFDYQEKPKKKKSLFDLFG